MLINTFLDTEDFVHLYYPEDETPGPQGCGAGARLASKYPRPPTPEYKQVAATSSEMSERERYRAPPQPEPPPVRVRAADLYPRVRTHFDEPNLDAGFTPICGEFVQWVGRTQDDGTIAMSNYRLHLQPRRRTGPGASIPLRLIDALEIRDAIQLVIICKHGRQLLCSFDTNEQAVEWCRRLNAALVPIGSLQETFAAAYAAWARELPPTSVHRALLRASQAPQQHWFKPELERLGFLDNGAWRVTNLNKDYKLCPSYPQLLIVPATVSDEIVQTVARFRAMRRFPTAVWRHRGTGAVIARSAQPEVGWLGWRSDEDELMLASIVSAVERDRPAPPAAPGEPSTSAAADATLANGAAAAPADQSAAEGEFKRPMLIVDARSYTSAVTNRARGGGYECDQYYSKSNIDFMNLVNIHHVRRSFQQMRSLCASGDEQAASYYSNLERSLWLQHVCNLVRAAVVTARALENGKPVLVHCSDGWDRTPQIVAAAQLVLDPYYRTVQGFRVLIEREWLDFGHKFADRCGHRFGSEDPNERSPIFLQWLHVVYQMMVQYPCSFEFNEAYLIKLATHVYSCMFGTFLCNSSRERAECRATDVAHVWQLLSAPAYRNHLYTPPRHAHDQVIWPDGSLKAMHIWWGLLRGERERDPSNVAPSPPPVIGSTVGSPNGSTNVSITKTKSCDNLLNEDRRTTQRRSSDPTIVADAINLLSAADSSTPERSEDEAALLTDSCVERLPRATTQTGRQSEPFASGLQDIASNSSSLERELAAPAAPAAPPDTPNTSNTSDELPVFVGDPFADVITMAEAARESARTRNISITWRSISESSNQSLTALDAEAPSHRSGDPAPDRRLTPVDNRHRADGDHLNHNPPRDLTDNGVVDSDVNGRSNDDVDGHENSFVNGHDNGVINGHNGAVNGHGNGGLNGHGNGNVNSQDNSDVNADDESDSNGDGGVDVTDLGDSVAKFLEIDLNAGSSDSDASVVASQLTLCPASPRSGSAGPACALCRAGGAQWTRGRGAACGCGARRGRARCVCGAGARAPASPDGLPPAADPLQARLHQIILTQKKVVEELSVQLREAREALRRASPSLPPPYQTVVRAQPTPAGDGRARGAASRSGSAASSSSGSASDVEVGEEARGVLWLPDSAAPRCQHCCRDFWLARRRHHCRRCGGIFCSACSEMSPRGDAGAVRVCARCLR